MGQISNYQDLVDAIDRDGVQATVKANRKPPLHTRILRDLYDLYLDQPKYVEFLVCYPLIPSDLAERIAQEADPSHINIARGLATNPRASQQTLNRLAKHLDASVRLALAGNPNLTPKECQILVEDENDYVRAELAANPSLPIPLQFVLSADDQVCVRCALAARKTLDLDIAVQLGRDEDPMVRAAIICSWSQDDELLHLWAERDQVQNQQLLFRRNKALESALLETLCLAPDSEIRKLALAGRELTGPQMLWLAESDDTRDRVFLAGQADLPASIQRMLAQDSASKVRRRLAANTCIDPTIARHIASSDDSPACRELAKNDAIQDDCITQLCTHPDDNIALLVAYRDDLNAEHRDLLFNGRTNSVVSEHLAYLGIGYECLGYQTVESLAHSDAPSLRAFASQSTKLDGGAYLGLSQDPADGVRYSVARNPATPEHIVKSLFDDINRDVVFAAEDNMARRLRAQRDESNDAGEEAGEYTDQVVQTEPSPFFKKIVHFFTD
ncbi:hypothetical protein [Coraliomargarita parva]|uniref:hypothetical protein n=1 Tax=Coraliomargarita parva TaxID=3014050 RepID=UPI0022B54D74|nr:hypothetical protein [Coraliomargarita parva]